MKKAAVDSRTLQTHSCETRQIWVKGSLQGSTKESWQREKERWNSEKDKDCWKTGFVLDLRSPVLQAPAKHMVPPPPAPPSSLDLGGCPSLTINPTLRLLCSQPENSFMYFPFYKSFIKFYSTLNFLFFSHLLTPNYMHYIVSGAPHSCTQLPKPPSA